MASRLARCRLSRQASQPAEELGALAAAWPRAHGAPVQDSLNVSIAGRSGPGTLTHRLPGPNRSLRAEMPYSFALPASAPLANAPVNAAGQSLDQIAPQIAAGAALNVGHIRRSRKELEGRKHLRLVDPGAVSEDSISKSEIRHHALLYDHVAAYVHPGALAPHWFAAAINPLTAQVAGIAAQNAAVAAQLAALTARFDNERFHRQNRHAFHAAVEMADDDATGLSQVMKTIAGVGPGLPNLMPIPAPVPVPPVGALPGPLFPADIGAMRALTVLQLNHLAVFFNDSFGIVAGDALDVQLKKFKAYICGV